MKRVAVLGPDFVPSSMPPALRLRFLVNHLPEFGWEPTVVSTDPAYYEWSTDPENERLLDGDVRIIRTRALSPSLTRRFGVGDLAIRSFPFHWRALSILCRRGEVDVLLISVPPYLSMLLGRLIHLRYRVPYVIDYQDPWVSDTYRRLPPSHRTRKMALAYWVSRLLEPVALRRASRLVAVSHGTLEGVLDRSPWLSKSDTSEIPLGAEEADFAYLRRHPRPNGIFQPDDGLIHLTYVGACIPQMYETVRALFAAINRARRRAPATVDRLRLHFVGTTYAPRAEKLYQVLPLVREAGLDDLVTEHPPRVPYLDALQLALDSHATLALGSDAPHYTASKIFPAILSRRPVLALFHRASTVVSIVRDCRAGWVIPYAPDDPLSGRIDEIADILLQVLRLPPDYQPDTNWAALERYTTRAMAETLARVLDSAIGR